MSSNQSLVQRQQLHGSNIFTESAQHTQLSFSYECNMILPGKILGKRHTQNIEKKGMIVMCHGRL